MRYVLVTNQQVDIYRILQELSLNINFYEPILWNDIKRAFWQAL